MDDNLPEISESQYNAMFGGSASSSDGIPEIKESEFNAMFGGQETSSINDLLGNPATKTQAAARAGTGQVIKSIPFNVGDEIFGGMGAGFDWLSGKGNTYDQRLQQARNLEEAASKTAPTISAVGELAANLAVPFKSSVGLKTGALAKTGQAAKEGASLGALYGFGEGKGLENRLESAKNSAALGAATGGVLTLSGQALVKGSKKLGNLADDVRPPTAEDKTIQNLGITRAEYTKANKFARAKAAEDNPLAKSIDFAKSKGIFKDNPDPEALLSRIGKEKDQVDDAMTAILKKADDSQTDIPDIKLGTVESHISSNPFQKQELAKQLESRLKVINQEWDGTISGLNEIKRKIGKIGYKGTTESQALDKALYTDLRIAVEEGADKFGGQGLGEQIRLLNQDKQKLISLEPIVGKARDKALQASTASPKGNYIDNLYNTAALGELAIGHSPYLLASKLAYKAATTDTGRKGISKIIEAGAGTSDALSKLLNSEATRKSVIFGVSGQKPKEKTKQEKLLANSKPYTPQKNNISLNSSTSKSGNQAKTDKVFSILLDSFKEVESSNNPKAVSYRNGKPIARGAYQFTPATAKDYNLKDPFHEPSARKAAEAKIMHDYKILGSLPLAVAAYNAGLGGVQSAIKKANSKDWSKVKKFLPAETVAYVPKIDAVFQRLLRSA